MFKSCIILFSLLAAVRSLQPAQGQPCLTAIDPATAEYVVAETTDFYNPYPCALTDTAFLSDAGQIDLTIAPANGSTLLTPGTPSCAKGWSRQSTGFGFYNCNMKVPGIAGTVTSCVAESAVDTPYENVYIKFFGNDTRNVHVGFYTGGRVQQAGPLALTFNPTLDYHVYSFEVTTNYIKWYIDGVERSSEWGARQLPVQLDRITLSLVTENKVMTTENTAYYTDATIGRVYDVTDPNFYIASFTNVSFTPQALGGCSGFNPSAPLDTSGLCSVTPAVPIYTESADNSWTITAAKATLGDETSQIHSGAHSMAFTILPGATLTMEARKPFIATDYFALEMWLNGGSTGGIQIYISAVLDNGAYTVPLSLTSLLVGLGGITAGVWSHVVIPFSSLGLSPSYPASVHGFKFTFPGAANGGLDAGRTFYLDDLYLVQQYPMCANSSTYIYKDSLADGVVDQSFGGHYSLASTSPVYEGNYAISWDMYGYDGLKFVFPTPFDTTTWEAISFRVNFLQVNNRQWTIYFTSPDSTADGKRAGAAPLNLVEYYGGVYPAGTWPLVIIPLREFGIGTGIQIDGIVFACNSNDFQGTLALDEIAFISSTPNKGDDAATSSSATTIVYTSLFTTVVITALYLL